jgi:hypothetical protein
MIGLKIKKIMEEEFLRRDGFLLILIIIPFEELKKSEDLNDRKELIEGHHKYIEKIKGILMLILDRIKLKKLTVFTFILFHFLLILLFFFLYLLLG